ncbi:glycosyltransferase [Jannaschia formosa]|uniref:glycosyltransferase n=1 Tax=Jannaschia formosa TaxID=2259592 RepID=UPI000E1B8824|nr:glycosyltransferase [Jannaschia formosa]TFL17108.1 glycosyltransferase [Jannaschia formosa]
MLTWLRRLEGLFQRFDRARPGVAALNARATLRDGQGKPAGRLERVLRERRRLAVAGRTRAPWVELRIGERVARVDRPEGGEGAFSLALPLKDGEAPAATLTAGDGPPLALRFPPPALVRAGRMADFGWRMVRLVPAVAGWAVTRDPRHRGTVKRMLDLEGGDRFGPLPPGLPSLAGPPPPEAPPATIVLPVHDGHDLLIDCLDRLEKHTTGRWRLIAVEDCSKDPRIRPLLRARLAALPQESRLLEPERNLGFVGGVNAALAAREEAGWEDGPVVLLNSDALVPEGWLPRLLAPLADPSVASVTPLSNDAEITTVPTICVRADLPPGAADRIDAALRSAAVTTAPMPTGVGFCMALSGEFLARVPRLDEAFGPGYGEEVDWCQKTRALGGVHLGLGTLFVEHRGGSSFGSETKLRLIARNHRTIMARYPAYDAEVQEFLSDDPLRGARLMAGLAWAGAVAQVVPVYLAHWLGGGAEMWLKRRIGRDLARGRPAVVLRVGGTARWQLELHAPTGITGGTTEDADQVAALLALLPRRHLVYSCGVGDPDPMALPGLLLRLRRHGDGLEVLLHDWFPVSPSYTLLGADGAYRGPVGPEAEDPAHRAGRASVAEWQAEWGRLMAAADKVVLFSEAGRPILAHAFPGLDPARITVRPHALPDPERLAVADPPRATGPEDAVLGVLGNINHHKGADVIDALARAGTRVVVLGQADPARPLVRAVQVHGGYAAPEIPELVRRYGITHWLVPSIWPETFSFVTHEALATGLPVLGFDIGAQGAALRAAPNGHPIPFDAEADQAAPIRAALMPQPGAVPCAD